MSFFEEERERICRQFPETEKIFYLEKMLIEAGFPHYFNFFEDANNTSGVNWAEYNFLIEIGRPAGLDKPDILVCIGKGEDRNFLEIFLNEKLVKEKGKTVAVGDVHQCRLTAEMAMEIIEKYFLSA